MSLLKHIEENVEHLYSLIKHVAESQLSAHGHIVPDTKALLAKLEEHLDVAQPAAPVIEGPVNDAPVVAPVVADPAPVSTPVVEAPVVAQAPAVDTVVDESITLSAKQSAANKAN